MAKAKQYDVVIIGAGAAGLAAAVRLAQKEYAVAVFEARDRVGGRCWTLRAPSVDVPIELGAEFIHGEPAATQAELASSGMACCDAGTEHWFGANGRLTRRAAFSTVRKAMRKTALLAARDLDFATYLR